MPKCKYCGEPISRILDKDICPFCGKTKPLEGVEDITEDYTRAFEPIKQELAPVKHKSRVTTAVLCMTLGVFGAHAFYIGRKYLGLILLGIFLALVGGVGCILFFTNAIPNVLAFLIPYFLMEIAMIVSGIMILRRTTDKDANGEFLQ